MSMCQMLLSINPEYVEGILQGIKRYEYRKFRCRYEEGAELPNRVEVRIKAT